MIIKEINIRNFGNLSSYSLTFNDNLNQIIEKNGYGKTTILNFIKAMLYGIDNNRKERSKFMPWNGGICGGNIVITSKDEEYTIERTFGSTAKYDTLTIYDKAKNRLSIENLGQEFVGLDEQSFVRCLYTDEKMLEAPLSASLIGKLSNANNDNDESASMYEKALKRLDEKRQIYQKTGNKGLIFDLKNQIFKKKRELTDIETCETKRIEILNNIKNLTKKENEIQGQIEALNNASLELAKIEGKGEIKKQFDILKNKEEAKNKEYLAIQSLFPNGYPDEKDLLSCADQIKKLNIFENKCDEIQEKLTPFYSDNENLSNFEEKKLKVQKILENAQQEELKKPFNLNLIFLITAFAVILGGIICIFTLPIGIIIALVGVIASLVPYFVLKSKQKKIKRTDWQSLVHDIFKNFKAESISSTYNELSELDSKSKEYNRLLDEKEIANNKQQVLQNNLRGFFSNFKLIYTNYENALDNLKKQIIKSEEIEKSLNDIKQQINSISINEEEFKQNELKQEKLKQEKLEKQNTLNSIKDEINKQKSSLTSLNAYIEQIPEINQTISEKEEELKDATTIYENVQKTLSLLKQAKQTLSQKFIVPTQNNLNTLVEKFDETKKFSPVSLKDNLDIVYTVDNAIREQDSLSLGLKHSFALLTRFALALSIFKNEKITIFLDDPFSFLDKDNFKTMQNITKNLSQNFQIIYFTCTKDREL